MGPSAPLVAGAGAARALAALRTPRARGPRPAVGPSRPNGLLLAAHGALRPAHHLHGAQIQKGMPDVAGSSLGADAAPLFLELLSPPFARSWSTLPGLHTLWRGQLAQDNAGQQTPASDASTGHLPLLMSLNATVAKAS